MANVKFGVLLPTRGLLLKGAPPSDADLIIRLARQAEAGGLDSVWVGDSLTAKVRLEPLAVLAAVAACTDRVRLGTAVLLAALRHPVLLAQTAATVDLISRGRLVIGAGVGGAFNEEQVREWQTAGVPHRQRAGRLEEVVQVMQRLGAGQPVTFSGRYYTLDEVVMEPRPVQPGGVPILLAAHGRAKKDAQIARVARLGNGVMSISDTPQEYGELVHRVRDTAAREGRDPSRLESAFYMTVNIDNDSAQAELEANDYLTRYYGANIWGSRWGPFGPAESVAARIAEYADAGAETVVVRFASFQPERQLATFLEQVAPAFA